MSASGKVYHHNAIHLLLQPVLDNLHYIT